MDMTRTIRTLAGLAVATTCLAGCTVKKQEAPALSGPSELATAISLSANPDTLRQDGSSQSQIVVIALDSKGQPVRSLPVRLDISVNGTIMDFGQVSERNVVTSADGRATVVYTSPLPPADPVDNGLVIQILATPVGSNYGNTTTRAVSIRLVPPGIILPPNGTPTARFVFVPSAPVNKADVTFDATSSTDDGQIVSYAWNFGDTTTGSGPIARHQFDKGGSYTVTLRVTDDRGFSASTTATVVVTESTAPEVSFVYSPTTPLPREEVVFNAGASKAGPGRTIVSYEWEFGAAGSPSAETGVSVTTHFLTVGTYVVTLTVTDDIGSKGTLSKSVTVKAPSLIASFVFSPSSPASQQSVYFDASGSSTDIGHNIQSYEWNFGDNGQAGGRTTNHTYASNGSYAVTLTVRDDTGASASTSKTVTVSSGDIEAVFTFSPTNPRPGDTVYFNAERSTSLFGLTAWEWDFGDGTPRATGQTISHPYVTAATYTVVLTVRDSMGRSNTKSNTVTVALPTTPIRKP
jgi:PKD repeat protein